MKRCFWTELRILWVIFMIYLWSILWEGNYFYDMNPYFTAILYSIYRKVDSSVNLLGKNGIFEKKFTVNLLETSSYIEFRITFKTFFEDKLRKFHASIYLICLIRLKIFSKNDLALNLHKFPNFYDRAWRIDHFATPHHEDSSNP